MADIKKKSKNENTYRFKTFTDRVNEIDLRSLALYHIGHQNEELPEDNETYFHQTLKKWMVLNLTEEFQHFCRPCKKIVTLPQLIHKKDFVVDLLLERLATASNLCLQPLLELLYVLGRDLREEFYVYFQRVLDRLICLLNTQDADQLEWTLICLAYLFKALKPYLKKNIGVLFNAILPLLDEQRYEEHVTNFAVECFSFIARDVRDYRQFLDFVLDTVAREQLESVQGCGRLLYEIMRGVQGNFHSSADDFLQFIFDYSTDEYIKSEEKSELLREIVKTAVQYLLRFIHPQNIGLLWTTLCQVTRSLEGTNRKIKNLLDVFLIAARHSHGRYLDEIEVVVPTIFKVIDSAVKTEDWEAMRMSSQFVSSLLMSGSSHITQLDTVRMMKKILTVPYREIFDEFALSIADHPQFEMLALPFVVDCFERELDLAAYELLAKIILKKQPLTGNASGAQSWATYPVHVQRKETLAHLQTKIEKLNFAEENVEEQLLITIIAPHIEALDKSLLQKPLMTETTKLLEGLELGEADTEKTLMILSVLVEVQMHLKFQFAKKFLHRAIDVLLPHGSSLRVLGCLDQLLTQQGCRDIPRSGLSSLLAPLLSSHNHDTRLLASHCLLSMHRHGTEAHPYAIFYEAECIQPDIHNYRGQLLLLQKLETGGELFKTIDKDEYKADTLRFLLGMLHHNFKFLWEPVLKLIEEYARAMKLQQFWAIYKEKMEQTAKLLDEINANEGAGDAHLSMDSPWRSSTLSELLPVAVMPKLSQQQLLNYRNLLWTRLPHFGPIPEIKNRDLVAMFLKFVNEEYRKNLENHELTWNLRDSKQPEDLDDIEDDDYDGEEANDDDAGRTVKHHKKTPPGKRKTKQNSNVKAILQTLQIKMGVFVNQPNPKGLHREPELYDFYMDLLAGPNPQLQKIALDCVMAYNFKILKPYKEQLYAIIDEQKFREALLNFNVDDLLNAKYRRRVMIIVLRLLYGKMITKGTQRNISSQVRKSVILRFLGYCSTDEKFLFLRMAFGKYETFTEDSLPLESIPQMVKRVFTLTAVWSPKKLQSIVNLLELIRKEFGGVMEEEFHLYMLKLLTFVGSVCNEVLQADATQMHPKMPIVFRNVKNLATLSLVNFFSHIDEFAWQEGQLQCLTEVFVWPSVERLPVESIHTPTPLLKLLLQWGEKANLCMYLNQRRSDDIKEPVIFHYIIDLLLNEKSKPAVRRPIMGIIEVMLVRATIDERQTPEEQALGARGLEVIVPFIPQILKRLKMNFSTRSAKQSLDKRDLHVLSLLTGHVEDAETCDSLLQLLLPVLIAKSQSSANEEVVCQVITTLTNLIKRLEAPETYLRKVAPLFEQVHEVAGRKLLCQLVADIAKKRLKQSNRLEGPEEVSSELLSRLKDTARIVLKLNAWDRRWVEQPDYDKRLDALKEVAAKLDDGSVDLDLGVLVIFNCCYFLKYDKDMSLRDNASEHLRLLLPKLAWQFAGDKEQLDYLIGNVTINLLRRIVRDTNENLRNEGIRLLGEMVRQCPDAHEIFSDLAPLADSQDPEVDFFENLVHLQAHRHGRALLKFCSHAETLTRPPNVRLLTQFVLPLASRYLLHDKHSGKHTLVDAAIEAVGVSCQLLPWQHYHAILRYYLMKMRTSHDHQKQAVRIVVRILDAFHFDLTESQAKDMQQLQKLKTALEAPTEDETEAEEKAPPAVEEGDEEDEEGDVKDETNLDSHLNEAEAEAEEDDEDETKPSVGDLEPVLKRTTVLSPNASKRVMATISGVLLPTLNRSITEKSSYDVKHKVNRKRFSMEREEEEILRVPIALAMVKLLQKLPKVLLDAAVPGVFMKSCTFLRSPLKSVRMLTRDILKKIMLALGASYLPMLMDHLQTLLTRGFQVHVLSVTVHGVLDALRGHLQPDDIVGCLNNLLDVALNDIFGEITAEKEIDKIAARTPEAKPSAKSYLTLHIVARNIRENCLLDLLMPFKQYLARSQSRKLVQKVQDCFAKIVAGLVENPHIPRESLLVFIYGTMSESITDLLLGTQKRALTEKEKEKMRRARPDCHLITPAPVRREGAVNRNVKSNAQANAHILIEFGLEMLHYMLKRKKLLDLNYEPFLNPVVPLLSDSLKSTHVRMTTLALKCFTTIWNDEYELSALGEQSSAVVDRVFEILRNFSTFGATKQEDNNQLVKSAFKAVVALLRKWDSYKLTEEQVEQLILHVEQDLYEDDTQLISFTLLKAMLARKINTKPIHDIMRNISKMAINSPSDYIRAEARSLLLIYVMEYALKRRVEQLIKFFSVQLAYELPSGRMSAVKFLQSVVQKFPQDLLAAQAELLYVSMGTRLVNDDEPDCRAAVAECLELLITRMDKDFRNRLFDLTLVMFNNKEKPCAREMAALLFSRFLNAEKQSFAVRLKLLIPALVNRLTMTDPSAPGRFVRAPALLGIDVDETNIMQETKRKRFKSGGRHTEEEEPPLDESTMADMVEAKQREIDHEIIQIQFCLFKVFDHCSQDLFVNEEILNSIDELAYQSQKMLAHDHVWVRCNAARIISNILSHYDMDLVGRRLGRRENGALVNGVDSDKLKLDFIYLSPEQDIKSLILDLCALIRPEEIPQNLIDDTVKIFLFVASMLRDVPFDLKKEKTDDDVDENQEQPLSKINLYWLVKRIRFLINREVVKASHSTNIRSAFFTLIEGLVTLLRVETLEKLAPTLVSALVREMSEDDQNVDADLRQLALRVGSRLRKRIGSEKYDKIRSAAQTRLMIRRAERKKNIAQEKIHDPVRAAKRKAGVQERKKAAKKRKNEVMWGKAADVKQKLKKRKRKLEEEIF